ncbi:MAG: amidohydrolase family protein [Pseudomonadota bacterium]
MRLLTLITVGALAGCAVVDPPVADLLIRNANVVAYPGAEVQYQTDIALRDGLIVAIGQDLHYAAERRLDADGHTVTAGFWNAHVHLDATSNAPDRQRALDRHWLRFGFVGVVDTGSTPGLTRSLIADVGAGHLRGPTIVRAGGSFVAPNGTPSYLPGIRLPELGSEARARAATAAVLADGADGVKIFSGSFQTPTETIHLDADVIRAVADTAHDAGAFVITHPTDLIGVRRAVESGVDILAHTAPSAGPLPDDLLAAMIAADTVLVPTLYLFEWQLRENGLPPVVIERYTAAARGQLTAFHQAGGTVIFGTDAGFVTDYDPTAEYQAMAAAGLSVDDILASLTTHPTQVFGRGSGQIEIGEIADLVLLDGDPYSDVTVLARVRYTVRDGVLIFENE